MPWIIAVIAGLVLGTMLVSSREARLVLAGTAALLVVLAAGFILADRARDNRAATMIGLDEIELRDTSIEKRRGLFYVLASVKNLSDEHEVASLSVQVQAHDCPEEKLSEACEIIGDNSVSVNLKIPAGQVRRIEELIDFSGLPEVENLQWSYTAVEVRANTR